MVEVVNMKQCPDWGKPGDVCIDRTTKWGNPYLIDIGMDRNCVCDLYAKWFINKSNLKIEELKNVKRLGCHCKPKRCHGDFLKKLIDELDTQVTL